MNEIDPYGQFQWYLRYMLVRTSSDDERQINRWKKIVSRFRGTLVKMIKDADSEIDDYSFSSKIRQIFLHWGYELTEKNFLLTQFQTIIYVTSEFSFCKKDKHFLAQFQTIIYITSEFKN